VSLDTDGWLDIDGSSCGDSANGCWGSYQGGFTGWASSNDGGITYGAPPKYRVQNGIVYLRGIVYKPSGTFYASDMMFWLPANLAANVNFARHSFPVAWVHTGSTSDAPSVTIVLENGKTQVRTGPIVGSALTPQAVCLDGIYWHHV